MEISQALPLFFATIIIFIGTFFNNVFTTCLEKVDVCEKQKEIDIDENLGNYFDCLTLLSRKSWYIEEMHLRQKFDIETLNDRALTRIKEAKNKSRVIKDCPNYEITSNFKYAD